MKKIADAVFPAGMAGGMMYDVWNKTLAESSAFLRSAENIIAANGFSLASEFYDLAFFLEDHSSACAAATATLGAAVVCRSILKMNFPPRVSPERIEPYFDGSLLQESETSRPARTRPTL